MIEMTMNYYETSIIYFKILREFFMNVGVNNCENNNKITSEIYATALMQMHRLIFDLRNVVY